MTLIGYIVSLVLIITKHKPVVEQGCIIFAFGENWGGITLGTTIIVSTKNNRAVITHEKGHVVQNALMGPLFPFVIAIPSLTRATYRTIMSKKHKKFKTGYMDIWFEATASLLGSYLESAVLK